MFGNTPWFVWQRRDCENSRSPPDTRNSQMPSTPLKTELFIWVVNVFSPAIPFFYVGRRSTSTTMARNVWPIYSGMCSERLREVRVEKSLRISERLQEWASTGSLPSSVPGHRWLSFTPRNTTKNPTSPVATAQLTPAT
jgi:hypothetical protein